MPRHQKQINLGIYPDTEKLIDDAVTETGISRAALLRSAINLGIQNIIAMHRAQQQQVQRLETLSGNWSRDIS